MRDDLLSTKFDVIRIIAKGPIKSIKQLAAKHGIDGLIIEKRVGREVFAHCPENEPNTLAVMAWFTDPDTGYQAPFSSGTCLWYGWDKEA